MAVLCLYQMERRSFLTATGGALAGPAGRKNQSRYYVIDQYFLKTGIHLRRIHEYFSKTLLPAVERAHAGPVMLFEALAAPHLPQAASIAGFDSLEQVASVRGCLARAAGPEPPCEHSPSLLIETMGHSPGIAAAGVFELRVYHSPAHTQVTARHKLFHRAGVHPMLYGPGLSPANKANLTYLIPFDSLAAREKAWNACGAEPIDGNGQVASVVQIALYRLTKYSPVR